MVSECPGRVVTPLAGSIQPTPLHTSTPPTCTWYLATSYDMPLLWYAIQNENRMERPTLGKRVKADYEL